jgi:hypothetical protein
MQTNSKNINNAMQLANSQNQNADPWLKFADGKMEICNLEKVIKAKKIRNQKLREQKQAKLLLLMNDR